MATAKEMRALIGKEISFKCDRSRMYINDIWCGEVIEQARIETYISGDWYRTKQIEVVEVFAGDKDVRKK